MKLVTCRYCGQKIDREREEVIILKDRCYAHVGCCSEGEGTLLPPLLDKDLIVLYDYINQLFNYEKTPVRIKNQIKKYVNEEGYTYSGILATLKYFYELQGGDISKANDGITIVEYMYDIAKKYYFSLYLTEKLNEDKTFQEPKVKEYKIEVDTQVKELNWDDE